MMLKILAQILPNLGKYLDTSLYLYFLKDAHPTKTCPFAWIVRVFDTCRECGKTFPHSSYLDHLFQNKECMRRYWHEEEKTHVFRLRQNRGIRNLPK